MEKNCDYCLVWAMDLMVAALDMILAASFLATNFHTSKISIINYCLEIKFCICICSTHRKACDAGSRNFTLPWKLVSNNDSYVDI